METSHTIRTPLSTCVVTVCIHVCVLHMLATATIQGWYLFRLEFPIVWLLAVRLASQSCCQPWKRVIPLSACVVTVRSVCVPRMLAALLFEKKTW